jgi:hypothetical protein
MTDKTKAELVADAQALEGKLALARGNPVTQSVAQLTPDRGGEVQRGSGYRDAVPLTSPPGVAICDQLVDRQDEVDRADLALRLARSVKKE